MVVLVVVSAAVAVPTVDSNDRHDCKKHEPQHQQLAHFPSPSTCGFCRACWPEGGFYHVPSSWSLPSSACTVAQSGALSSSAGEGSPQDSSKRASHGRASTWMGPLHTLAAPHHRFDSMPCPPPVFLEDCPSGQSSPVGKTIPRLSFGTLRVFPLLPKLWLELVAVALPPWAMSVQRSEKRWASRDGSCSMAIQ